MIRNRIFFKLKNKSYISCQVFSMDGRFISSIDGFGDTASLCEANETFILRADAKYGIVQKLEFVH